MLVTVLIANHNYERWLPIAIDSALQQTHPEIEVVVVDDGSTDGSRRVLDRYRDRVQVLLKDNEGHAAAINDGFECSRGEVVCLLDSDDVFLPDKVQRVAAAARSGVCLIHHPLQAVDPAGHPVGRPWPRCVLQGDLRRRIQRAGGFWPHPLTTGLSFRRGPLAAMLPIPGVRGSEGDEVGARSRPAPFPDTFLAGVAPFLGEVVGLPEVLGKQRLHGANTWTSRPGSPATERERLRERRARLERELELIADAVRGLGEPARWSREDNLRIRQLRWAAGDGGSLAEVIVSTLRCPTLPWPMKWREAARAVLKR